MKIYAESFTIIEGEVYSYIPGIGESNALKKVKHETLMGGYVIRNGKILRGGGSNGHALNFYKADRNQLISLRDSGDFFPYEEEYRLIIDYFEGHIARQISEELKAVFQ